MKRQPSFEVQTGISTSSPTPSSTINPPTESINRRRRCGRVGHDASASIRARRPAPAHALTGLAAVGLPAPQTRTTGHARGGGVATRLTLPGRRIAKSLNLWGCLRAITAVFPRWYGGAE